MEKWQQIEAEILFQVVTFFFMSGGASVRQPTGVLERLYYTTVGLCVQCHT